MSTSQQAASDRTRVWILALVVAVLTLIPYLYGWLLQGARPDLGRFIGFGNNLDDGFVYLSWMRQATDSHFFQSNLFTSEPQTPHLFNLFFLLLGNFARLTHLQLVIVFHVARVAFGIALIRAVWWLAEMWIPSRRASWAAILLVCFSAGLGWIPGLWQQYGETGPIDTWQPEAITFFSIYLNPLFTASMLLMVGALGWLWIAQRDKSNRAAFCAGICGFLLGNIHTYDVITVCLVWAAYLGWSWIRARRIDTASLLHAVIAGIPTAVSAGYNLLVLRSDPLFAARANVATLSAPIVQVILGYGILVPLALLATVRGWLTQSKIQSLSSNVVIGDPKSKIDPPPPSSDTLNDTLSDIPPSPPYIESLREPSKAGIMLVAVWAAANLAAAYLPVPFQRKMLMGEHIPLCFLAGMALARLIPAKAWLPAMSGCLALVFLTNYRVLTRDIASFRQNFGQSQIQRPYLYEGELSALTWIREHAPAGAVIQPLPWTQSIESKVGLLDTTMAAAAPGFTGHPVDAGHWGETPSFGEAMSKWVRFMLPKTTNEERIAILRQSRVRYLIFSQKHSGEADSLPLFRTSPPAFLHRIDPASNADADVYEVTSPLPVDG